MLRALQKLPFRILMTILSVVPLLAVLILGGWLSWDAYRGSVASADAVKLAQLARNGIGIALTVPNESNSPKDKISEARQRTDAAFAELNDAYTAVLAIGFNDPALAAIKGELGKRASRISEYRTKTDEGNAPPLMALEVMQPVVAASADLTRRTGMLVSDPELANAISGYFAIMQVSDAYQMLNRLGQQYLKDGTLPISGFGVVQRSDYMIGASFKAMAEQVPADIVARYRAFFDGPHGKAIETIRASLLKGENYQAAAGELEAWVSAHGERRVQVSEMIRQTGERMMTMITAKAEAQERSFYVLVALVAIMVVVSVGLSILVSRVLSRSFSGLAFSMKALADGDRARAIPYVGRKDEIGDMARSVEVFRQAAIRNSELEASAEQNRLAAEQERADVQRRAEAEAEERLIQATGSLATGLRQLASGDLVCEIDEQFAPQFEALRHDFNASVQQLREAMQSVGQVVGSVTNGSGEISQASDNLAKRTEQQAASLEETAAALEEITSNVTATSKRTGEARDLVRTTREQAEKSGTVVNNAVSAMEKIEHSSRQISQIIGVIDEIAFQTNLLALNAGVEAARAGDAGKGFAVVAQEVRELAQRSANAAKEIKGLIGNSEVAVNEGVKLVNDTGEGLNTIAGLVQAINAHMDAIATAAQEQSVGLGEVNTAVNHMDQATQQNAAMVEEMNAAGASLAQESGRLAELVARFRTGESVMVQQKPAEPARAPAAAQRRPAPIEPSSRPAPATRARPATASLGNTALATKIEDWEEF
ncbi:MAG TPA: methyl-accepting chemotaxis protein [Rhizobium sp.]|nr:methyl-accepting chemotaxis protein [Rhizobium sp.]